MYTRTTILRTSARCFSTTARVRGIVPESVAQAADKVDKSLGKTLASGLDKAQEVTEQAKEALGATGAKAKESTEQAKQKANELQAGAEEAKDDIKSRMK